MDIVIEAAVEAAGELLSAGIDAVVDKAVKHKSEYKSEYRRKHTMAIKSLIINPGSHLPRSVYLRMRTYYLKKP